MWPTIHRARRRLIGDGVGLPVLPHDPAILPAAREIEDVVIILGRVELDRLRHALQTTLRDAIDPPNTPARIEAALALLLERAEAPGRPRVLRRPAGVSAPESWEVHLDGVEHASGLALREAGRTGRFSA